MAASSRKGVVGKTGTRMPIMPILADMVPVTIKKFLFILTVGDR
jgi:hypothetical protein